MTRASHREKYNRLDTQIWKRTSEDKKGQTTMPKRLRQKIGLNGKKMRFCGYRRIMVNKIIFF